MKTEKVAQKYTVSIPYTEIVDGKPVTRLRSETRTRTVKVQKAIVVDEDGEEVDQAEIEKEKTQRHQETYIITVPYQEFVDGKAVKKTRVESRIRTVDLPVGYKQKERLVLITKKYKSTKVTCYDIEGIEIPSEKLADRFSDRQPVILISDKSSIDSYFSHLLNPKAIFVVAPESGIMKTTVKPVEEPVEEKK